MQADFQSAEESIQSLIDYHEKAFRDFEELNHLLQTGEGVDQPGCVLELSRGLWNIRIYDE